MQSLLLRYSPVFSLSIKHEVALGFNDITFFSVPIPRFSNWSKSASLEHEHSDVAFFDKPMLQFN